MAATVVVGCKLPHGLAIRLAGRQVLLAGSNSEGAIGGYGLTRGVDKAQFEDWLKEHETFEPVARDLIFAVGQESAARATASERKGEKNGFEPLDPTRPDARIKPEKYEGMPGDAA